MSEGTIEVQLHVNGGPMTLSVPPRTSLADALRGEAGLTGTHIGCEHGSCGACTVLLDGEAVRSCLLLAVQADGMEIETVEGLSAGDGELHPLQEAFLNHGALQCGFCTPGFLMQAESLARRDVHPTGDEVAEALGSNLCRCTGYVAIRAAVAEYLEATQGQASQADP